MKRPAAPRARPTPTQRQLLRALLADDREARAAWESWSAEVDLDTLEAESMRLLPQLSLRLSELGVEHPEVARLRGVHRSHWYRNQILLREIAGLQTQLAGAGIHSRVSGGAALVTPRGRDVGARPLHDAGLLLLRSDVPRGLAILRQAGWSPASPKLVAVKPAVLEARAGGPLRSANGFALQIGWRLLERSPALTSADRILDGGATVEVEGVSLALLSSEAQLLQIFESAAAPEPRAAWVADAAVLLRNGIGDWRELERLAVELERAEEAFVALAYLAAEHALPVPSDVLARLAIAPRRRVSLTTSLERAGGRGAAAARFLRHVEGRRRLGRSDPGYAGLGGLARYLCELHGLASRRELMAHYAHRISDTLRGRGGR